MARTLEKPYGQVIARLMEAYGANSLGELARLCGAPENTVRNWHKRDSVPLVRVRQAAADTARPFEWFISGYSKPLFLRGEANELAKCDAADAFGQGQKVTKTERSVDLSPRASPAQAGAPETKLQQNVVRYDAAKVDPGLLSGVLAAVLEELRARGLELPTEKLAELVALVYEDLSGPQADDADQPNQAQRTAKRYLRLVA